MSEPSSVVGLEENKYGDNYNQQKARFEYQGRRVTWLVRGIIGLSLCTAILFIVCFALIADLEGRVDDSNSKNSGGSNSLVLSTSPAGTGMISELYRGAGQWAIKKPLPYFASDVATTDCGGKIYIVGGLEQSGSAVSSRVFEYDPIFETYTNLTSLPTPRYRHGVACISGASSGDYKLFVVGGFNSTVRGNNGQPEADVLEYNAATQIWQVTSSLIVPRGDHAIAQMNSSIYVFGGYGLNYNMGASGSSLEILDTAAGRTWTSGPNMPTPRGDVKAAVLNGKIYVVGGWNDVSYGFQNAVEAYNPLTNIWESLAPLPVARGDCAVAAIAGSLVVAGGEIWSGTSRPCDWDPTTTCSVNEIPVHNVEQYDPATNHWTPLAPLPTARFRFDASSENGALFVFGGHMIGNVDVDSVDGLYLIDHPSIFVHKS
mmetsp:Transcript_20121/g.28335  ORF Transcript_20121/g.28335 Transcript_20121/m.28335 type:complete len:430 (-) Transcript_20121:319-1608(-)|eukprot:CAMPEP_0185265902 /NCGR_PEP_ID=MMETSP1359-20130426/29222_1 /TAXON_ID=552665 /ORGANISM="Bigelowiella longifila, Strain CCMP242" /LENGTH=429 /DNA_ID=CAMNT_0027855441 /DNA_START=55 /DNA_END=1344 /DNA_ORIENTATION=+